MTNEELVKLQDTQYHILVDVVRVCNEHAIKYFLAFGTLLGAVRHSGSIPWDCDIDICMDSENFNKFSRYADELSSTYDFKSVGGKWGGLSRVYKKGSLLYDPSHGKNHAFPIHIDIFKMEFAKPYGRISNKFIQWFAKYLMIAKLSKYEKGFLYERFKNNYLKLFIVKSGDFFRLFASEEQIEHWVHHLIISDTPQNNYTFMQDLTRKIPVSCFGNGIDFKYESSTFHCPEDSAQILELTYGNFMELPPVEERFTSNMSHLVIIF